MIWFQLSRDRDARIAFPMDSECLPSHSQDFLEATRVVPTLGGVEGTFRITPCDATAGSSLELRKWLDVS